MQTLTVKQVFPKRKKFTVREVEKLYEFGFLKPDVKVELINGEIYKMSPIGLKHALVVNVLGDLFNKIIRDKKREKELIIQIQNPLFISRYTLLEPDVAILSRNFIRQNRYPKPEDVELLVEVSDTTLKFDKNVKLTIYAKAKIKKVWIVNLIDACVEVYEKPEKGKYTQIHIKTLESEVEVCGEKLKVSEILHLTK